MAGTKRQSGVGEVMKTASGGLITLLNTSTQFMMADLIEIKTISGYSRYASSDVDITYNSNLYIATGPLIRRSATRVVIGLETDTMTLHVSASVSHLLEGLPFVRAALNGALDSARVTVYRAFLTAWNTAPTGVILMFAGRVSNVEGSRNQVQVEVKSDLEILSTNLPRNLYQPPCVNTLFDSACGVLRTSFLINGTVTGGSVSYVTSALGQAAGWFDQGTLEFLTGNNVGVKRTVKVFTGGRFDFALPLPYAPVAGDTFKALPGCDKAQATCNTKFSNLAHNTSFPYIPAAEVAL